MRGHLNILKFPDSAFAKMRSIKIFRSKLWRHCFVQPGWRSVYCTPRLEKQHDHEAMSKIRNIGIMAHIDGGKTTTTERMLYYSGFSKHLGDVDHGDTVMDYMEQERDRGITITSAAITFHWAGYKINLIDTPGHVDFTVEVERSLRVLDGAVAILDASAGVEAQTLTVWRQADNYHIPRLVYLNKMDKPGASLELCLQSLQKKLHVTPLVLNLPVGSGREFTGVLDLVNLEKLTWDPTSSRDGSSFTKIPIDIEEGSADSERVLKARADLIGQLADMDEHIADLVLCDTKLTDIPVKDLISAVRTATLQQKVVPVFCGSSLKNKGVQPLLDAVGLFLPSPMDISYGFAKYYESHLCALAFKVQYDKQRGPLTYVRIYSGMLNSGAHVFNINRGKTEKTSRLLQVYADELHDISAAVAGNIIAIAGLKETFTGDTITSTMSTAKEAAHNYVREMNKEKKQKTSEELKASELSSKESLENEDLVEKDHVTNDMIPVLAGMAVPDPVFFCSVEPSSMSVQKNLDAALDNLQKEDPSLRVEINSETGQTVLSGMGELHLDIIKSRLQKEYGLDVDLGPLQIAYRETVIEDADACETLDKTLGGKHQFVQIRLSVHPDLEEREFKHVLLERTPDHPLNLKHKVAKAVESGIKSGLSHGVLLNFPVIHTRVCLHEFTTHYHTTLPMITAAAAMATQKALRLAGSVLLEPMMGMEITTEEDKADSVLSDLGKRRSHILNVTSRLDARVISAVTPLQELMGYSTELRTITSGTASCSMELSHYEKMSEEEIQKVTERITGFHPSAVY
ncbi:ribosome-releasing factor 2, mitochondrial [Aplysia californica]|uniref:Ribosome-releasing factor 2, mitochondrial n=1 Tax=Aplysia californica TaxID=6500 RepID=A0ABM0K291_APLCA|nr:ribosome-releasing factor 2, mitochondrial [Aplysia californica]